MPRLFIATTVTATPPLQRVLDRLETLRPAVKPVRPDRLHLTYRFLGEVAEDTVELIVDAMADPPLTPHGAVRVAFQDLGRFPAQGARIRVVFARPQDPGPLLKIADTIDARLADLEGLIPPRDKPFTAHLTLARMNPRRRLDTHGLGRLTKLIETPIPDGPCEALIDRVELIQSTLRRDGPIYETRRSWMLGGGDGDGGKCGV